MALVGVRVRKSVAWPWLSSHTRCSSVPCPLGWGAASHDTIRLARLAHESGVFPVFEAEHGEVTGVSKIRRRVPVEDYLRPQKRFAHLFGSTPDTATLARLQAMADRNIQRYGLLDEEA